MRYILKTNKLLINSEKLPNNAFIYTGSPNKDQKDKGKLIIILEFPENTDESKELGNLLIQKIHKLYYSSTLIDQESILENILEEVNENLPLLTHIDNNWLKKFNAIIAIIYRQETYFSPVGNVSAWIANNEELINIFEYLENDDIERPTTDKIFTNILSGNIEPNQVLIFTTNSVFDYVTKEKVESITINNDPSAINIKLKELLFKITNRNFCLVSIKLSPATKENIIVEDKSVEVPIQTISEPEEKEKIIKKKKTKEAESEKIEKHDDLLEEGGSEKETVNNEIKFIKPTKYEEDEIIQEEQPMGEFVETKDTYTKSSPKESIDQLLNLQQKTEDILKNGKSEFENRTPKIKNKSFIWKKIISTAFRIIQKIINIISYPFIVIRKIIFKSKNRNNTSRHLASNGIIEGKISNPKNKLFRKKIILISALILLIAFVSSVFLTQYFKKSEQDKQKVNEIINTITDKKTEYDLISIYKDEKLAKEKLKEISELISQLPQKTDEQKKKYEEILDSFTETLNKVWNINSIKNPVVLAETPFYPEKIIQYNDSIIAFGRNSSDIVKINTKTKNSESFGTPDKYSEITSYNKNQNFIYGIDTLNKLVRINLDNKNIDKVDITYHPNFKKAIGMAFYNDKLYILDSDSNQIYKHNSSKESFSKGEAWITDNTDIKNALSIAIDSTIYLGRQSGTITALYTGKQKVFTLKEINPTISSINKIYTDNTIKEIYFMDAQTKRIIIINKSGDLIKQYYFPTLNKLDDFIYDNNTKTIYLQSENKIIEVK